MNSNEHQIHISFKWMVGDTRPIEKLLKELVKNKYHYFITVTSRIIAFGLTFLITKWLFQDVEIWKVFLVAIVGSYSLWVSWLAGMFSVRQLENIMASDPENIGVNDIKIDRTGIYWDDAISRIYSSWQGIEDVVQQDGAIWLKTGKAHGFFIPARLFDNEEQRANCLALIKQFRKSPTTPRHLSDENENTTLIQ